MTQPASHLDKSGFVRQFDQIAWAIFFIWIGFAMLVELSWGWFLLGVAVIILTVQFARWQMGGR